MRFRMGATTEDRAHHPEKQDRCGLAVGGGPNEAGDAAKTPSKSILDPTFEYVPAAMTDLKKRFARERKRIAEEKKKAEAIKAEAIDKVRKLGGLPK